MSRDRGHPASPEGRSPTRHELTEHLTFVRSVAIALVDDPELAEDLSQEAILAALHRPPTIERDLRSWLGGVVRNLARVHYRERARRRRRETMVAETRAVDARGRDTVEEAVGRAELRQQIAQAVLELEDPYRTVLILRYMENLTPTEIAEVTQRPVATVKTHLQRGLDRLRGRFDDRAGSRDRWRSAFLGLLLPLPVLLANASVASAASAIDWGAEGTAVNSATGGTTAIEGGALAGGTAAGGSLGLIAWAPVAAVLALATWWVIPPTPEGTPNDSRTNVETERGEDLDPATPATERSDPNDRPVPANAEDRTNFAAAPSFVVVDEAGEPIAGASIRPAGPMITRFDGVAPPTTFLPFETDGAGRASLPAEFEGLFEVSHPEHLAAIHYTDEAPEDEPWSITLSAGVLVTLVVTDREGVPIEGAEVSWKEHAALPSEIENAFATMPPLTSEGPSPALRDDLFDWTIHTLSKKVVGPLRTDEFGELQMRIGGDSTILQVMAEGFAPLPWSPYDLTQTDPFVLRLDREARLRLLRREPLDVAEHFQLLQGAGARGLTIPAGETMAEFGGLEGGLALLRRSLSDPSVAFGDLNSIAKVLISSGDGDAAITAGDLAAVGVQGDWAAGTDAVVGQPTPLGGGASIQIERSNNSNWLLDTFTANVEATGDGNSTLFYVSTLVPPGSGTAARPIELLAGEVLEIWIDEPPAGLVSVDVQPPAEPGTRILSLTTPEGIPIAQTTRGEDGYRFDEVAPGDYTLVLLESWKPIALTSITVGEDEVTHTFQLPRGELILTGLPPRTPVLVERESAAPPNLSGMPLLTPAPPLGGRTGGWSDEEGQFTRGTLPIGRAVVWWQEEGELRRQRVEITDSATPIEVSPAPNHEVVLPLIGTPRSQRHLRIAPGRTGDVSEHHFADHHGSPTDLTEIVEFDALGRGYVELRLPPGDYRVILDTETSFREVHPLRVPATTLAPLTPPREERVQIRGRRDGIRLDHGMICIEALGPAVEGEAILRLDGEGGLDLPLPVGRYAIHFEDVTHEIEVGSGPRRFELSF